MRSSERPLRIRYLSHGFPCGYGEVARRLILALAGAGIMVEWVPVRFGSERAFLGRGRPSGFAELEPLRVAGGRPDVVVVHAIPELLPLVREAVPYGVPTVLHTIWESEVLQAHWPALIDAADAVVVPTAWNADAFAAAGVTRPIAVVPHGVDPTPPEPPADRPPGFVVHSIAAWAPRKAPWLTVEAFSRAFGPDDDAHLILRTDARIDPALAPPPGPPSRRELTSWWVARILHAHAPAGGLSLVHRSLSPAEVAGLHHASDCWLSLPRAEGWNVGAFDAAAAGTPVVTTAHGGQLAYLDPDCCDLIGGEVAVSPGPDRIPWIEPDVDAAVACLRAVRADPEGARARIAPLAARLQEAYRPSAIARAFVEALGRVGVL